MLPDADGTLWLLEVPVHTLRAAVAAVIVITHSRKVVVGVWVAGLVVAVVGVAVEW